MIQREYIRLNVKSKKGRLIWHTSTPDGNYLLCNTSDYLGGFNGRVIAVTTRQEHKPPRPLCKTCAERITPGYSASWTEVVREYHTS